ncbi:hypothetical protein D9758_000531 [Tetrapyrgos nigripes]|uniref:DRBM domain-containing protein n=1 Tax=Tetrapyrgos nigripes TaxID=182062 RepID=A0A8H5LZM7_9AGAR|nr:hypothetical protein D9758_000531 [Tetrapyrgos nigripes]
MYFRNPVFHIRHDPPVFSTCSKSGVNPPRAQFTLELEARCVAGCSQRINGRSRSTDFQTSSASFLVMPSAGTAALNNYLQAKGQLHSLSWVEAFTGPRHAPTWTMTAKINGEVYATASAMHKNVARDIAATETLTKLREREGSQ